MASISIEPSPRSSPDDTERPVRRGSSRRELIAGRYELVREVARGGHCVVYLAEHRHTGRRLALKRMRPEYAGAPIYQHRLLREARALELSRHPNVVDVLDAGLDERGEAYLTMEMVDARGLDGWLTARGKLPVEDVVAIGAAACAALAHAHHRAVIHRDIKPANILVGKFPNPVVKLIDFGVAATDPDDAVASSKLTRAGELLGTPEYMAPERLVAAEGSDLRSDLYALGVVFFELLTGVVPFPGTYAQVLLATTTGSAPDVRGSQPNVPASVADLIAALLAGKPEDRPENAQVVREALLAIAGQLGAGTGKPLAEASTVPEARRLPRAPFVAPVRFQPDGDEPFDGRIADISAGGALVFFPRDTGAVSSGQMRFVAPLDGGVVSVRVSICWSKPGRGGCAAGVAFQSPPPQLTALLAEYVRLMTLNTPYGD